MLDLRKTVLWVATVLLLFAVGTVIYLTGKMHGRYEGQEEVIGKEWKRIVKTDSLLRKQTETCMKLMDALEEERARNERLGKPSGLTVTRKSN